MANVTEKDIIDHLKEKIKFHEKEAKRVQDLLYAFTGTSGPTKIKQVKAEATTEAKPPLPEKEKGKPEKSVTKPKRKGIEATASKPLTVPEAYSESLTLNEKIAFALKEIGSGFNEDIAKAMAQYEPQSDEKKISKQISGVLSALKTTNKIKTTRDGRRDKYSLS